MIELIDGIVGFWLSMLPLMFVLAMILGGLVGSLVVFGPLFAAFFQPYRKIPRSQVGAQKVKKHA